MTEDEKRAHALHAGLKALELFVPVQANRTTAVLVQYTMLAYNWISQGIIGNSVIPSAVIEPPLMQPARPKVDPSVNTSGPAGG